MDEGAAREDEAIDLVVAEGAAAEGVDRGEWEALLDEAGEVEVGRRDWTPSLDWIRL